MVLHRRGRFDRTQTMFVDREFVIFVELQQAAGMSERRNQSLQHAQFVQIAQQFAQPRRLRQERQEPFG